MVIKTFDGNEIANNTFSTKEAYEGARAKWVSEKDNPIDSLPCSVGAIVLTSLKEETVFVPFDVQMITKK